MTNAEDDKNLKKISKDARVPGNLVWKPVKFELGFESGHIIVEINSSNRTWMEENHAAFDEAYRILKLRGFKMVTSIRRIPITYGRTIET